MTVGVRKRGSLSMIGRGCIAPASGFRNEKETIIETKYIFFHKNEGVRTFQLDEIRIFPEYSIFIVYLAPMV